MIKHSKIVLLGICGAIGLYAAAGAAYPDCPETITTNLQYGVACTVPAVGISGYANIDIVNGGANWLKIYGDTPEYAHRWEANGLRGTVNLCYAHTPWNQGTTASEPCPGGPVLSVYLGYQNFNDPPFQPPIK